MTVDSLLDQLSAQGVELWFEGARLRFRAPRGALNAEQRARLVERRDELIAALRQRAAAELRVAPLSYGQRSLWFVHQEEPESAAYHVAFAVHVLSAVNHGALQHAIQALVDRHAILRTTYEIVDGRPSQRIAGAAPAAVEVVELPGADDATLRARIESDYRKPFDLRRSVLRATLFSRGPHDHVLLINAHHIAIDGWSLFVLLDEFRALYAEAAAGTPASLPRLDVQYTDYVEWQRQMIDGAEGEKLAGYWQAKLAAPRAQVELSADRARPPRKSVRGATGSFLIDATLTRRLTEVARDQGTTLFVLLLAAFKILLFRYTGTDDIVVGAPMRGRTRTEFERILGYFVNPVPLRSNLTAQMTVNELTSALRQTLMEALEGQEYPLALMVERLQPRRDPSRSPLFETTFAFQHFEQFGELSRVPTGGHDVPATDFGGMKVRPYPLHQAEGQFDLAMSLIDGADGRLDGTLAYNTALFDAATIERLAGNFQTLLRSVAANPGEAIGRLAILSDAEQREQIERARPRAVDGDTASTLHERFEQQVQRTPDAIAVNSGGTSLTYAELNRRANRVAHRLRELGVGPETLVGLCLERSPNLVVGLLGILKAGGAYLPIDLSYPAERVAFMLEDARSPVLLTERSLRAQLPSTAGTSILLLDDEALATQPESNPPPTSSPDNLVYVIYTSGSTGKPKGTQLTHRAVHRLFTQTDHWYGFGPEDVWTLFHSSAFDFSVWEIWGALLYGGRLVVVPFEISRSPEAFLRLLHDERVTVLNQTPSAFRQLMQADLASGPAKPWNLRFVIFGGEALELQSLRPWFTRHGDVAPTLVNMYGITETCVHVTYRPIRLEDLDANLGSVIGVPIPDLRIVVLDANGNLVPDGVVGEMFVGGSGLARGYLERPELTAARFIPDPFYAGERLYRTGDLARRRSNGDLEYFGRIDQQVKIRGFRIELGEIESVLVKIPGVQQCVVTVREDRAGDQRLVGYVVPARVDDFDPDAIRSVMRLTLPDYMVPSQLVAIDAVPLTSNGKVDRARLPQPPAARAVTGAESDPVMSPAQRRVAEIWRDVLAIDHVGVRDNFFDLGGHSLLLVKLQSALNQEFGASLALVELFEHTTVADQAARLSPDDVKAVSRTASRRLATTAAVDGMPADAIAIVGMAGRFPQADGLEAFWQQLRDGVELLETFSDEDMDAAGVPSAVRSNPKYVRRGTVLENADLFDAAFFRLSPRDAQILDPQHRILLECAWEALEHAGYAPGTMAQPVGVYAGTSASSYLLTQIAKQPALAEEIGLYHVMLSNEKDFLCTRISYNLDLQGPSMTIQTACSTSLVAVDAACRALAVGECDIAIAGGVSVLFPQRAGYLYQDGMILSPDGRCRPFDAQAQGTRSGSGGGVVVLKRLSDAIADRDTIHAVIRGTAVNNDGAGKAGYTAPSIEGQAKAIAMALERAQVEARTVSYVETHGTGTPLGDPIEIEALRRVFGASGDSGFCRLGALKANIGHLDAAAGVAGLIKAVLAMQHREYPPLVNFDRPNPQLNLERSPFVASAAGAQWDVAGPRRAGVSSFGIGGTNAHVVVEEAPPPAAGVAARDRHLMVLSAKTPEALDRATARLAAHLRAHPDLAIGDVEFTLQSGRQAFTYRRAVVVADRAQALTLLDDPRRASVDGAHEGDTRPVAFLFSGQGSQYASMGAELYRGERVFRDAIDRCAELLRPELDGDLREVMFAAKGDTRINETRFAQPALFVFEYALATLWMQWGVRPVAMLGHSIGEYVAAHLAGVLSLDDALKVVAARGRLMQALPAGSMAAVHANPQAIARWLGEDVEVAAVNAENMCTVSGPSGAVTAMLTRLADRGIDSRLLHTSHAFHSAMMTGALEPFTKIVASVTLSAPSVAYVSNVTGTWITAEEATSPSYYAAHLRQSVEFSRGMATLNTDRRLQFLEIGPGHALTSLARMNLGDGGARRTTASMGVIGDTRSETQALLEAAGRLWVEGVRLEWAGVHADGAPRRVPLPAYPFERRRYWIGDGARAAAEVAAAPARLDDVGKWLYVPTWSRCDAPEASTASRLDGTWLVVGGPPKLAEAAERDLRHRGATPIVVDSRDSMTQVTSIVRDARLAGRPVTGALALWMLTNEGAPLSAVEKAYHLPVALAAALDASSSSSVRLVIATDGAQSVLDEPVLDVEANLVVGPVRVLPAEMPGLDARTIDLPADMLSRDVGAAARAVVYECAATDREAIVAWRAGRRWVQRVETMPPRSTWAESLPLKPGGVYLIAGGFGGIGLTLARGLAARETVRLVLTGRTAPPPREHWDGWLDQHSATDRTAAVISAIRDIERAGSEVLPLAADVADMSGMREVLTQVRARWGGVDGVILSAGVPGTGGIAQLKSAADVAAALSPKVSGLTTLVQLLGDAHLDFFAMMSALVTTVGSPGLADYAGANAVLDAFVDAASRPPQWSRVIAIDWGAWRDVGMAANMEMTGARRAAWDAYLDMAIPPAAGVEAFERALASGYRRVIVVPYDLHRAMERQAAVGETPVLPAAAVAGMAARPEISSRYEAPVGEVEQRLADMWAGLLGIEQVGVNDDFFDLGGHSLLATRVLTRIEDSWGVKLALRDVFDAPTVRRLAEKVGALSATVDRNREEMEF